MWLEEMGLGGWEGLQAAVADAETDSELAAAEQELEEAEHHAAEEEAKPDPLNVKMSLELEPTDEWSSEMRQLFDELHSLPGRIREAAEDWQKQHAEWDAARAREENE